MVCFSLCRYSSGVEHVIGNDGVVSPILISGTINKKASLKGAFLLMRIGNKKRTYGGIVKSDVAVWIFSNRGGRGAKRPRS